MLSQEMGNSALPRASRLLSDLCGLVERLSLNWMATGRLWVRLQIRECGMNGKPWPLPQVVVQPWVRMRCGIALPDCCPGGWGVGFSAGWSWRVWVPPPHKQLRNLASPDPGFCSATAILFPSLHSNWHPTVGCHWTQMSLGVDVAMQAQINTEHT